jgi:putative DNA-invertase from lambdoid prophage Rac
LVFEAALKLSETAEKGLKPASRFGFSLHNLPSRPLFTFSRGWALIASMEIKAAGFAVEAHRLIEENISGSVAAKQRPGFMKLIDRMERGDVLVVTKLDRLGRNAMDVRATVEQLENSGVRVHCLALGGVDLTSPAGKMTMQVIAAVAEFERDLLIERT